MWKTLKLIIIIIISLPVDPGVRIKESKKIDENLDLKRELEKWQNRKVTVISFVVGTPGTVSKGLEKRLGKWRSEEGSRPSWPQHC